MVPITATWRKPLTAGGTPITVHGVDSHLPDRDGLLDPPDDPGFLLHMKNDLLQVTSIGDILAYS